MMPNSATYSTRKIFHDLDSLPDTLNCSRNGDSDSKPPAATELPAKHLRVDTSRHGFRIPAFPLGGFKSAVFHDYKIYNDILDEVIRNSGEGYTLTLATPLKLTRTNSLLCSVEGEINVVGDDRISARFMHNKLLPGSEVNKLIDPEQSQAATITIGREDFTIVVLQEILRADHKELAEALGVVCPVLP
ncbi:hypothetical protein P7C70_g2567, partial [Phenoliferia sp. Uapishka_3]